MRSRGNAVVTIPNEEKGSLELKRSKVARLLYAIGGTVALVLAMLGIVVPGLPVTPFALLSAFLYAKSSKRMYDWLLNNRVLGPRIKNYQRPERVDPKRESRGYRCYVAHGTLFIVRGYP